MLIEKMLKTISQHNLISSGDRIVVGLSGGADSVALLTALLALRDAFNLTIIACHVNHKIRSGTAERDQKFVENLCSTLGVECHVKEAQVEALAKEWGLSVEEAGRRVRYDFFNEIAGETGKIATAHHMNDNVETVLMRFMRGTGLHGLTGIPYRRDNIIRPLLNISRSEIEEFLRENNISHITDESNFETIYTRNKIRLNLIPEIQRKFNSNFLETLTNNIGVYREEDDFIFQSASKIIPVYFKESNDEVEISKEIIEKEHVAVIKRAILMIMKKVFNIEPSSQVVKNINSLLVKPSGTSFTINDELIAIANYKTVVIRKNTVVEKDDNEIIVDVNSDSVQVGELNIKIERVTAENVVNNSNVFYLPVQNCSSPLIFRTRRDGDVIVIAHGMKKKLKKFFIDQKVPAYERDKYWMLVDENKEVFWIPRLFGSRLEESKRCGEFVRFEVLM